MKFVFKVTIIFLIVFNFRLPTVYNSVFVAVGLTAVYYFLQRRTIPFTYFNKSYVVMLIVASFLMCAVVLLVMVLHDQYSNVILIKRFVLQLFMICSMFFAYPILIEDDSRAFEDAAAIICWAFAAQGVIHLAGFLYEPFGNYIFEMKGPGFEEFMNQPGNHIERFRGYALCGSIFMELPSAYGAASIMFFRLMLMEDRKQLVGWTRFFVIFFIIVGIMLSGRTGFIGVGIGIGYYLIFMPKSSQVWMNILKVSMAYGVVLFAFYFLLSEKQKNSLTNEVFPFAFEAYYNWKTDGHFHTSSSDALMEGHYYSLRTDTYLMGQGVDTALSSYKGTDAGYINAIVFGGIFYLLALAIFQYLFFARSLGISASYRHVREGNDDFWCFLLLFIYLFIIEYKGAALGTQHLTEVMFAFLCLAYLERYYYRLDYLQEGY